MEWDYWLEDPSGILMLNFMVPSLLSAQAFGKVTFYYIDIEKFPQVGEMLQVSSVPHVFAVKGGEVVDEFTGVQSDQ